MGYLLVFAEYLCNRSPKMKAKNQIFYCNFDYRKLPELAGYFTQEITKPGPPTGGRGDNYPGAHGLQGAHQDHTEK